MADDADLLIRGGKLWDGSGAARRADLHIRAGRIAAVADALPALPGAQTIDAGGGLVMPGLVDGHAHLDKTLWGTPWHSHRAGTTLAERIANERRVRHELGLSPQRQSARLVAHMVARGTTHARSHVDVGPEVGLAHLHGVLATREAQRAAIDLQLVAFPQAGVMIRPGTLDLLDQAAHEGAEVIGGIDPLGIDGDPVAQLDAVFAIAARRGCGIDIHLHDRGEAGVATVERIIERTRALGLAGRVAISHAFCLGMLEPRRLDAIAAQLAACRITLMTHGPGGGTPFPPVRTLADRGVHLVTGSDGVRDSWTPLNTGDMLERAYLVAYVNGLRHDADLELALRMASVAGAELMGCDDYGIEAGCAADLVIVEAENAAEAVALHPPRRWVIKRGRIVARDGRSLLPGADRT